MAKCAYCSKQATTEDAVGIPACQEHSNAADEYFERQTGRKPTDDTLLYCKEHLDFWQPDCERCEECCQHHYGRSVEAQFGRNRVLGKDIKIVDL